MKQWQTIHRLSRPFVVVISVILVAAGASAAVFVRQGIVNAGVSSNPAVPNTVKPQFSFGGAAGWHKGPTNKTSMALFSDNHECFTSIEHKAGTVNADTEIQKQQSMMANSGDTMIAGDVPRVTVQTDTGPRQYGLHEFGLSSGDKGHPLMGGVGLGYVQLASGYLEIQSHCNTVQGLASTIPALQAYEFNKE